MHTHTKEHAVINVICAFLCVSAVVPVRKRDHEKALVFLPETNVDLSTLQDLACS